MKVLFLAIFVLLGCVPASAWTHGNAGANALCPKGTGLVDLGGTTDSCASSTANPSFQWTTAFDDVRESGQAVYHYNDSTLLYNVPCVDNGCGYDTTQLTFTISNESFTATTASITSGVLFVNTGTLGTGGNPFTGQTLSGTGIPAGVHITTNVDSTHWNTDGGSGLNTSTETISGQMHPQIGCFYATSIGGVSGIPIINCQTTGDATTPWTFNGYDFTGAWLRIVPGSGGGANGLAGPGTITNNKFVSSALTCNNPSIQLGTGSVVGFNVTIAHNQHDGNYPNCTGGATNSFLFNDDQGSFNEDIEWNAFINEPSLPMSGNAVGANLTIAHNAFKGFCLDNSTCLSGGLHAAVYANSLTGAMGSYNYTQNFINVDKQVQASACTVPMSILSNASSGTTSSTHVTFDGNITIVNLHGGVGGTDICQTALWQNVGVMRWDNTDSHGNLTDPIGISGGLFTIGNDTSVATSTWVANAGTGTTTVTMSGIGTTTFSKNYIAHVNNTPYTFCAAMAYNNDNVTATLTLDLSTPGCPSSAPPLAVGYGIQSPLMPGGTFIFSKTSSTVFVMKNYYCSFNSTCNASFNSPHSYMWTACSMLPIGTTDPNTGSPSTGTGTNSGTYMFGCEFNSGSPFTTTTKYGPAFTNLPSYNDGTDHLITSGASIYLGGPEGNNNIGP